MTAREAVSAAIAGLNTAPVFPDIAPDGTPAPFITFSVVGEAPEQTLADGVPATFQRFQVTIYGKTRSEADSFRLPVRDAILALAQPFGGSFQGAHDAFESPVKLYKTILEFYVWANRSSQ